MKHFALIMMWLLVASSAHAADRNKVFNNFITSVEPPRYMQSCMRDDECIEVDPKCDNCCGSVIINKRYTEDFSRFKTKQCSKSQGGVCDCAPRTISTIKCRQGLCVKASTRPNRKEIDKKEIK